MVNGLCRYILAPKEVFFANIKKVLTKQIKFGKIGYDNDFSVISNHKKDPPKKAGGLKRPVGGLKWLKR